ncbi:MAG TPA: AAA family ATPase, partial [Phycisphaerae bacterium]|nr:AAA family ATPase [Phycisphaerae bacterium]
MKIIRLEAENVKRIRAVRIVPEGAAVVIGGNNGEGKTSVLDSIAYALGGKGAICEQPIRTGSRKARVICELDEEGLVVTRTFARGKPDKLVVADKAGVPRRGPQAILDALVGKLTFDPLGFVSMKPRDQLDTLKALVGLDFSELNLKRERLYDERTAVNRTAKSLRAQLAAIPLDLDAPDKEVSVAELMKELEKVEGANAKIAKLVGDAEAVEAEMKALHDKATEAREQVEIWQAEVKRIKNALAAKAEHLSELQGQREAAPALDPAPIRERIAAAEGINAKVRRRKQQVTLAQEVAADDDRSERLSGQIEAVDADKAKQLAAAEFPVEGLGFDDDRVLLNHLPFDQ